LLPSDKSIAASNRWFGLQSIAVLRIGATPGTEFLFAFGEKPNATRTSDATQPVGDPSASLINNVRVEEVVPLATKAAGNGARGHSLTKMPENMNHPTLSIGHSRIHNKEQQQSDHNQDHPHNRPNNQTGDISKGVGSIIAYYE
jgi:hypothetical protein